MKKVGFPVTKVVVAVVAVRVGLFEDDIWGVSEDGVWGRRRCVGDGWFGWSEDVGSEQRSGYMEEGDDETRKKTIQGICGLVYLVRVGLAWAGLGWFGSLRGLVCFKFMVWFDWWFGSFWIFGGSVHVAVINGMVPTESALRARHER